MEQITVNLNEKTQELRIGQTLELKHPERITISGNIDAPKNWLEGKFDKINIIDCHALVARDSKKITLIVDDKAYTKDIIEGKLVISQQMQDFGINSGKQWDTWKLADFIRMNRSCFKDKETAMKLTSELNNFVAKIDKELENSKNDRGDSTYKRSQVVKSNIPEAFTICIPVIKGYPKAEILIETVIDPGSLLCSLVSPDANDLQLVIVERAIDEQVELLNIISSNHLTIIEI